MNRNDAELSKVTVIENLELYTFTFEPSKHQDTIVVLLDGSNALVMDTAYPEYSGRVVEELKERDIAVKTVVLSHYHGDHVSGLPAFEGADIYASEFYERNFDNCRVWEPGYTYVRPTKLLKHGDTLAFGSFNLEFVHAPGHSQCSLITKITDKILHVGDQIMITKDRKTSLPFIADGGDFLQHARSLELIKQLDPDMILVPHGGLVKRDEDIEKMVDDRIYYLERVAHSFGTLPLPACLRGDVSNYDHLSFHDTNLMRLV